MARKNGLTVSKLGLISAFNVFWGEAKLMTPIFLFFLVAR